MLVNRKSCDEGVSQVLLFGRKVPAAVSIMSLPGLVVAQDEAGRRLIDHVTDSHVWHPIPGLPGVHIENIRIGGFTIPMTVDIAVLWFVALLLIVVFVGAFHSRRTVVSRGGAGVLEPVTFFVTDSIVYPAMGKELGTRWMPFMYTLFFFTLTANLLGMLPAFPAITGNLSITSALALMVFGAVVVQGMLRLGFIGFFRNLIPEGMPRPIAFFLFFIELFGLLIRNGVLAIRLFANMIAGHFVIFFSSHVARLGTPGGDNGFGAFGAFYLLVGNSCSGDTSFSVHDASRYFHKNGVWRTLSRLSRKVFSHERFMLRIAKS